MMPPDECHDDDDGRATGRRDEEVRRRLTHRADDLRRRFLPGCRAWVSALGWRDGATWATFLQKRHAWMRIEHRDGGSPLRACVWSTEWPLSVRAEGMSFTREEVFRSPAGGVEGALEAFGRLLLVGEGVTGG
jgi:hypothetical protein